ncbi:hypothetical protein BC936DRAFT_137580 [Jimgerdemannia flammicorona]|uniref:Glycosyltransferase 61 catalytic domain-containing protein n=1 Tax=Jimgerdemannia flammicorona TaxID=994334 RepID=A0A433CX16_9FUNG|nr:hypothetical protein BC936DRAFT_137580 [Jimgerdemannia flammicorona]
MPRSLSFLPWKAIASKRNARRSLLLIVFLIAIIINTSVFVTLGTDGKCKFFNGKKICRLIPEYEDDSLPLVHLDMGEQMLAHAEAQVPLLVESFSQNLTNNAKFQDDTQGELLDPKSINTVPEILAPEVVLDPLKSINTVPEILAPEVEPVVLDHKSINTVPEILAPEVEPVVLDPNTVPEILAPEVEPVVLDPNTVPEILTSEVKPLREGAKWEKWKPAPHEPVPSAASNFSRSDHKKPVNLHTAHMPITKVLTGFELARINAPLACAPPASDPVDPDSASRPYSFMFRRNNRTTSSPTDETNRDYFKMSPFDNRALYCANRYGWPAVFDWRRRTTDMCTDTCDAGAPQPQDGKPDPASVGWLVSEDGQHPPTRSKIDCHMAFLDIPENLCRARDIVLGSNFLPMVTGKQGDSIDMWPVSGTLKAQCKLREKFGDRWEWGYGGAFWLYNALSNQAGAPAPKKNITCDTWIDHDLFMISRYDISNVYHIHQDFMHTFLSYGVMDLDPETTEVIFLDTDVGGIRKSHAVWKQAFSGFRMGPKHSNSDAIRTVRDLAESSYRQSGNFLLGWGRKSRNICLRSATFSVHGGLTLLSRQKGTPSSCSDAPMLKSFADFMLTRLDLPTVFTTATDLNNAFIPPDFRLSDLLKSTNLLHTQYIAPKSSPEAYTAAPIIITFVTRRPVDGRPIERTISNEAELVDHLNMTLRSLFTKNKVPRPFLFRIVNFGIVPTMREQIAIARESDVLIGPHGAALVYSIYLPPHGCLVELQHPSRANNYQFSNIINLTGRNYWVHPIVDPLWNKLAIGNTLAIAVSRVLETRTD